MLGYPIRLALLLTCPTIDNEKESCDWNKYQAMITMAVFPSFVALAFDGENISSCNMINDAVLLVAEERGGGGGGGSFLT